MSENESEPTYTLAEAQRVLQKQECMFYGHSWEVISSMGGPVAIVCRCGESRGVQPATTDDRRA